MNFTLAGNGGGGRKSSWGGGEGDECENTYVHKFKCRTQDKDNSCNASRVLNSEELNYMLSSGIRQGLPSVGEEIAWSAFELEDGASEASPTSGRLRIVAS